jgi:hypothetical protein
MTHTEPPTVHGKRIGRTVVKNAAANIVRHGAMAMVALTLPPFLTVRPLLCLAPILLCVWPGVSKTPTVVTLSVLSVAIFMSSTITIRAGKLRHSL